MDFFDIITKIATITIAGCSLYFTRFVFISNQKTQSLDKKKDRNIQSLKVLILDHNLKNLYVFFENSLAILNEFKKTGLSDTDKSEILGRLDDEFINVRIKFVDVLLAIDDALYSSILEKLDDIQSYISDSVFDNGINLTHQPKFNEIISTRVTQFKTEVIKILYQYTV